MQKRILFFQPDRLACYSLGNGSFSIDREWMISGDTLPDCFRSYLESNQHAEFNLVFDLAEEECYQEDLKATGLRDRRHVIARIKSKRFENCLFVKARIDRSLGNGSLLLSGVNRNAVCENLISILAEAGVCLRSIHSSTTLTPELARLSASGKGPHLFVIPLRGCFRLVACIGLSVVFTRRVSVSSAPNVDSGDYSLLNKSLEETLLYMQRMQEDWMPSVVLIGPSDVANKLRNIRSSSITASQVKEIRSYLPVENEAASVCTSEVLLVRLAARSRFGYAQKEHRVTYIGRKIRAMSAALALCAFGGAITSVALANKLNSAQAEVTDTYNQAVSTLMSDISDYDSSYEQPVEAVRQALVVARLLELGSVHEPLDFLQTLVPGVQQPGISITSVHWETEDIVDEPVIANLIAQPKSMESVPLEQIYRATLAGVVTGRPDSALEQFESFISYLRDASSDPSIVVVETPFGLGNQRRTTNTDYLAEKAEFVLEISNERVE